ncbi:KH domain-containing protein [bacterium]|nr:MAG: KH domain-containing protein [bacterium]
MSSFDDEFGLFGAEAAEEERRPTLGARKIVHQETIIDEIEPEDEPAPRRARGGSRAGGESLPRRRGGPRRERGEHSSGTEVGPELEARAKDLLEFLARGLVAHKDEIDVIPVRRPDGRFVLELEVDPEDLGKVIGRGGRVAQALRTLMRAGSEGKVAIDIIDVEAVDEDEDDDEAGAGDGEEQ